MEGTQSHERVKGWHGARRMLPSLNNIPACSSDFAFFSRTLALGLTLVSLAVDIADPFSAGKTHSY